ncbi:Dihydrofolate reductase [Amycolatopsis arida]|uniref:Dihydrofolate reductase n=1 Tax=Amycolatopsis arida TaxID=587909 RepID=A0A1I5QA69_9PSEU|nr:dihydrofolate reductase family protein [Amycolatopsis arida]TDX98770.1 dihydrofolate reductase [Amycolatopsis arida]SFP43204.1 Dihydrofolate reductase [Amycolatopsis arida]
MSKVIWHVTMSMDGFISGPKGEMDWAWGHSNGTVEAFPEMVATTGAFLAGRRTYDSSPNEDKEVYGGAFTGKLVVLTHEPPAVEDSSVIFVSTGVVDAVAVARSAAGDRNVVVSGADVAGQCVEAGLVDEILVHLVPVLKGDGVRLFERPGAEWIDLETVAVGQSGSIVDLRYRPKKK